MNIRSNKRTEFENYIYDDDNDIYIVTISNLSNMLGELSVNTVDTPYKIDVQELTPNNCKGDESNKTASYLSRIIREKKRYVDLTPTTLPLELTSLEYAFYLNTYLIYSPRIPNSVSNLVATYSDCKNLKELQSPYEPTIIIPNGIKSLYRTFRNCNSFINRFDEYPIPNSVINMEETFFYNTAVEHFVKLPDFVENLDSTFRHLGKNNLSDTDLSNFTIPNTVKSMRSTFSGTDILITPIIPEGVEIVDYCFSNCLYLETVSNIPSTVISMNGFLSGKGDSYDNNFVAIKGWNLTNPELLVDIYVFGHAFDYDIAPESYNVNYIFRKILYFESTDEIIRNNISSFMEKYTQEAKEKFNVKGTPNWIVGNPVYPPVNSEYTDVSYDRIDDTLSLWKYCDLPENRYFLPYFKKNPIHITNVPSSAFNNRDVYNITEISTKIGDYSEGLLFFGNTWIENGEDYNFNNAFTNHRTSSNGKVYNVNYINKCIFPSGAKEFAYCFSKCELKYSDNINDLYSFPDTAEDISYAFNLVNFSEITDFTNFHIPDNIINIGYLFYRTTFKIGYPNIDNCKRVEDISYFYSNNTEDTFFPKLPSTVKFINDVFAGRIHSAGDVEIPNGVISMNYAFNGTAISEIPIIPDSVKNMKGAFAYCPNIINVSYIPSGKTDYDSLFAYCRNLETVEDWQLTPEETSRLKPYSQVFSSGYMFEGCTNLKKIYIKKPYTYNDNKWKALLLKINTKEEKISVKFTDSENNLLSEQSINLNDNANVSLEGFIDEFVHADSGMITDDTISKFLTYKKQFSSDSKSLDPSMPNFVLWAKDPQAVRSNILGGGGGGGDNTVPQITQDEYDKLSDYKKNDRTFREIVDAYVEDAPFVINEYHDSLPIGSVIEYAGENYPSGYTLCDGRELSREYFSELFDAIGIKYGEGDGTTTFNVPNITDRICVIKAKNVEAELPENIEVNDNIATTSNVWTAEKTKEEIETTAEEIENNIREDVESVKNFTKYSKREEVVGTWVDGKTIYRTVIDVRNGNVGVAGVSVSAPVNIDYVVRLDAMGCDNASYTDNKWTMSTVSGLGSRQAYYKPSTNQVVVSGAYYTFFVILEYTKTTDSPTV